MQLASHDSITVQHQWHHVTEKAMFYLILIIVT